MATNPLHLGVPEWTFGDRLRKAREVAEVTSKEMAALLEVSDRTIRNYERMATPIKRKDVRDWALRCGVPIEWLLHGDNPPDGGGEQVVSTSRWSADRRHFVRCGTVLALPRAA